jgi:hypothetical protein
MSSIKISELFELNTVTADDFFPLVDSGSMTTRRISAEALKDYNSSGSFSGSFYGELIPMPTQASSSYSSASLSSSHASVSDRVNFSYTDSAIPFWSVNQPNNSFLSTGSNQFIFISQSQALKFQVSSGGRPLDTSSAWYQNAEPGNYYGFIQSDCPIVCDNVITQARYWLLTTGSTWPSGAYSAGLNHTIGTVAGSVSSSLNNKWIRILGLVSASYANGLSLRSREFLTGRIKLDIQTANNNDGYGLGSNIHEQMIFDAEVSPYGGKSSAFVYQPSMPYNGNLIKKIRIGSADAYNGLTQQTDPQMYIDIMLENISAGDRYVQIVATSYGTGKFVDKVTIDTAQLVDTGSSSPFNYLIFDPRHAGYHTNVNPLDNRGVTFSGCNVGIGPYNYYETSSNYPKYNLDVSGSIHASNYNVNNVPGGTSGSIIVYQNSGGGKWLELNFDKGILTAAPSSSVAAQTLAVTQISPVPVGTIIDWAGDLASSYAINTMGVGTNWLLCTGSNVLSATFPDLASVLGTTWGSAPVGYVKLPDLRKRATYGSTPGGSNTNISASVGGTGGSENLKHYHFIGADRYGNNNDFFLIHGNGTIPGKHVRPFDSSLFPSGSSHMAYYVPGDGSISAYSSTWVWNSSLNFGSHYSTTNPPAVGLDLITTHGVGSGDSIPPNAIVHKLIRAR